MKIPTGNYAEYFLFLFLIAGFAVAADTASASDSIYQVQWRADGLMSEIDINGVTVDKSSSESQGMGTVPLNIWLKPGKNVIAIRLKPLQKAEKNFFNIFLARAQRGRFVDEGEKILEYSWDSGKSKEKLPLEKKIEFTPQSVPALELWTKTEQITLDAGTEKAIRSFLKTLSDAYTKADADRIVELQASKVNDYALAFGVSTAEMKKSIKDVLSDLKAKKAKYAPIDTAGAKLQLAAENRLVLVTAKDGAPPLVAKSPEDKSLEYIMEIYLARINGKWGLAR